MTSESAMQTFMDVPPRLWRFVVYNGSYGAFRYYTAVKLSPQVYSLQQHICV